MIKSLFSYTFAKNYRKRSIFEKVMVKIKRCSFFLPHSVLLAFSITFISTQTDILLYIYIDWMCEYMMQKVCQARLYCTVYRIHDCSLALYTRFFGLLKIVTMSGQCVICPGQCARLISEVSVFRRKCKHLFFPHKIKEQK